MEKNNSQNNSDNVSYTKAYVDERIKQLEKALDEMKQQHYQFKDQVLKVVDEQSGRLKRFDEEHSILTTKYSRINEKIHNHDMRIECMEKKRQM